jgi:hypothetical protein
MKKLLYFIIVLVLIDIWVGVNLANHQPPFSNPFTTPESQNKVMRTLKDTARRSTDAVERTIEDTLKPGP